MRVDQELIVKAASIARYAPREWEALLGALKDYAAEQARQCIASPLEQLQRMQGRAQQCAEMVSLLEGAVKSADSIASKMAGSSAAVQRRI